jgi:hypothetical protein
MLFLVASATSTFCAQHPDQTEFFEEKVRPLLVTASVSSAVDRFIRAELEEKRLRPALGADKVTLLRRVTFDMTGLPPTPEEIRSFVAGRSVKPGFVYGATDEIGYHAVEDRIHIHDFHATVLHLLGVNHEKLTYRYSGRDFRLTDVAGIVAKKIIA